VRVVFYKVLKSIGAILVIFGKTLFTILFVITAILLILILNRGCGTIGTPEDLAMSTVAFNNYLK
jgi:hypothetical protein